MSVEDGPDAMADDSQEFVELPIFSLEPANRIIGSGQVSCVEICRNVVTVATMDSRIHQWDVVADQVSEIRGGAEGSWVTRDNVAERIIADGISGDLVVQFRNGETFWVQSLSGEDDKSRSRTTRHVRPIRKLQGHKVVTALWIDADLVGSRSSSSFARHIIVGTKRGDVLLVRIPKRGGREETIVSLWATPDDSPICGLRIEVVSQVAVVVLGSANSLYHFSGIPDIHVLFTEAIHQARRVEVAAQLSDIEVISRLEFMSGSRHGNLASRKLVWVSGTGILQAELVVTRSRGGAHDIRTALVNKVLIPFDSESPVIAANLTAHHVLALHANKLLIYSQISGRLVQELDFSERYSLAQSSRRAFSLLRGSSDSNSQAMEDSFAFDLVRDRDVDSVWITLRNGHLMRLHIEDEARDVWLDAKVMGRFDLALELAPPEGREEILEAQADRFAKEEDYHSAVSLYARTSKPIESVLLLIYRVFKGDPATQKILLTDFLVRKLDTFGDDEPMQRTILASLIVELYASLLNLPSRPDREKLSQTTTTSREGDFDAFLVDHWRDLDLETALSTLATHGHSQFAYRLCMLWGDIKRAVEVSLKSGEIKSALTAIVKFDADRTSEESLRQRADALTTNTARMLSLCPRVVTEMWLDIHGDLMKYLSYETLVSGMLEALRSSESDDVYLLTVETLTELVFGDREPDETKAKVRWLCLLFQLYGEHGDVDSLGELLDRCGLRTRNGISQYFVSSDLGFILGVLVKAHAFDLCVLVYSALDLHEKAIDLAFTIDISLAEDHLAQLTQTWNLEPRVLRLLWQRVAKHNSSDLIGVVERSQGALQVEDVLPLMADFTHLDGTVKRVIVESLHGHRNATKQASEVITRLVEHDEIIRKDLDSLLETRGAAAASSTSISTNHDNSRHFLCGHTVLELETNFCPWCSQHGMINQVDDLLLPP